MYHRPHVLKPKKETIRVAFAYVVPRWANGNQQAGLGVSAGHVQKTLRRTGIWSELWPINDQVDVRRRLDAVARVDAMPVSHVVMCAPWMNPGYLSDLAISFTNTQFITLCHSNVGFLMADPGAVQFMRAILDLQMGTHNITAAGNSRRLVDWANRAWGQTMTYLPNLYDLSTFVNSSGAPWRGGPIRVGIFGAMRPLKNHITAVAACVELAVTLNTEVQIWINEGRVEGASSLPAIKQMVSGMKHVTLHEAPWDNWARFRKTVGHMHLLMQPSFTESFNLVTADGIAEGVPSVVSDAIDWVPHSWIARVDEPQDLTKTAIGLLHDPFAAADGQKALSEYVAAGIPKWTDVLLHKNSIL